MVPSRRKEVANSDRGHLGTGLPGAEYVILPKMSWLRSMTALAFGVSIAAACGPDHGKDAGTGAGTDTQTSGDAGTTGDHGSTADDGSSQDDGSTGDSGSATGSGSTTSAGTGTGEASCEPAVSSDLPGVTLEVDSTDCTFTLAEAAAGIVIDYRLEIEDTLEGVATAEYGSANCVVEVPEEGLLVSEILEGNGQHYCVCDVGLCPPWELVPRTLPAGSFPLTFDWDGRNWNGPSDYGEPKGDPFPAGVYTLELRGIGEYDEPGSGTRAFEIMTTVDITLVE